ncbi:coadhesin-like isoform X2 [Gigantopelta aegis]|uniref:coadhesin-like isoform X2 n=1 Tax=Gigantopelta aegis TaxID=1735272 RepID=UPI001B88A8DF|nr:coadhesin-like isoform X2 [Gigantopelta aegis]
MTTIQRALIIHGLLISCGYAEWSAWGRGLAGRCSERCIRVVNFRRNCTDTTTNNNNPCPGSGQKISQEACADEDCPEVHDQWSAWEETYTHRCQATCRRLLWMSRWCFSGRLSDHGGLACVGSPVSVLEEDCDDDLCDHAQADTNTFDSAVSVNGHWSSWRQLRPGPCEKNCRRTVEYVRTCTDPPSIGMGKECDGAPYSFSVEDCSGDKCVRTIDMISENGTKVDGAWSSWSYSFTGSACPSFCKQEVLATRVCNNPPPSGGGRACEGPSVYNTFESCIGDSCSTLKKTLSTAFSHTGVQSSSFNGSSEATPRHVHGEWSSWRMLERTDCTMACVLHVVMTRQCLQRALSVSPYLCEGRQSTKVVKETCSWLKCVNGVNGSVSSTTIRPAGEEGRPVCEQNLYDICRGSLRVWSGPAVDLYRLVENEIYQAKE